MPERPAETAWESEHPAGDAISWEADISPLRSPVVVRQLMIALGASLLFVWLLGATLIAIDGDLGTGALWTFTRTMLFVALGLGLMCVLIMLTLYRRYRYRYTLDDDGIRSTVAGGTARTNRIVNLLLLLTGRPSAAGAGLLAASRQSEQVRWSDVTGARLDPSRHQIEIRRGRRTVMLVQCTPEEWEAVTRRICDRLPGT